MYLILLVVLGILAYPDLNQCKPEDAKIPKVTNQIQASKRVEQLGFHPRAFQQRQPIDNGQGRRSPCRRAEERRVRGVSKTPPNVLLVSIKQKVKTASGLKVGSSDSP